jgi:hypothetical protein
VSDVPFLSIDGIDLFSATGDVAGAAVIGKTHFGIRFSSPQGTFGTNADYPLMTAAIRLNSNCSPGQLIPVNLNIPASYWQGKLGTLQFEYKQGSITIGGSLAVANVIPGGGVLPAGGTFTIVGRGFSPKTQISVRHLNVSSVQYVSPTEMRATVRNGGRLDGALIEARNPDGSEVTYYSYMRGILNSSTARPLLAQTVPIFPMNPILEAVLPPTISSQLNADYFTAIALQNSGTASANIAIEAVGPGGAVVASKNLALAPRHRMQNELSELFGTTVPIGSHLHIVADEPVQMLGLLANRKTAVVTPVWVSVISAPPPVPIHM